MTEGKDEGFENSFKYSICDHVYVEGDVKIRDYCHIIGKYRGSAYRGCNMNVKLNHKISAVLHKLQNCDSHLITRELD